MRHHFSLPRPIAALPGGMLLLTTSGSLVASARILHGLAAGLPRAAIGTVDLATVAPATDDHLAAAPIAQEQAGRDRIVMPVVADAA